MGERDDFTVIDVAELTTEQVGLLHQDVRTVADEDGGGAWTFQESEKVLLSRIGGQKNVKDYVGCLKAGRDAAKR